MGGERTSIVILLRISVSELNWSSSVHCICSYRNRRVDHSVDIPVLTKMRNKCLNLNGLTTWMDSFDSRYTATTCVKTIPLKFSERGRIKERRKLKGGKETGRYFGLVTRSTIGHCPERCQRYINTSSQEKRARSIDTDTGRRLGDA